MDAPDGTPSRDPREREAAYRKHLAVAVVLGVLASICISYALLISSVMGVFGPVGAILDPSGGIMVVGLFSGLGAAFFGWVAWDERPK